MLYREFIKYLQDNGCDVIEDGHYPAGDYFRNCINSEICYVDKVSHFSTTTILHIVSELKIAPPAYLEDDYEVYKTFRSNVLKVITPTKKGE